MPKTMEQYREIADAQVQHNLIAKEVFRETDAQLTKWGVQNHHMGTSTMFVREADAARADCEAAFSNGVGTWYHILKEEYWEAMAEEDPLALEKELIQVAAVAVSMVASSRRARGA